MRRKLHVFSIALIFLFCSSACGYTLSGNISGAEWLGGITYVYAISLDVANPEFHIGMALLGNGLYLILNVPEGDYILYAFQDRDGNLIPSVDDYIGYYGEAFPEMVTVTGNVEDLDIVVEPLPFTTITGILSCPEGNFGLTFLLAASDPLFEEIARWSIPLTLDGNAEYTLFVDPGEYYVMAYLDADFSFSRTSSDPQIFYGAPNYPILVDVTGGSAANIDLPMMIPPEVQLSIGPQAPPVVIPATGGSFNYVINVQNSGVDPAEVHAWFDVTLPDGSTYGPVLGPVNLNLPAGFSADRIRSQNVPGAAPAGMYSYNGYLGIYPAIIWNESSFAFEKTGSDFTGGVGSWNSQGEELSEWIQDSMSNSEAEKPESYVLCKVYPNPFNPTTKLSFSIPDDGIVTLKIFDLSGRLVNTLINGFQKAGTLEVQFNGTNLPSGVYLYRLSTSNEEVAGKMLLIK